MVTAGEAFLHHVPTDGSSYRMPLAGIVMAWYNGHAPAWARTVLPALLWAGPVVLAFVLASSLQRPGAGALAAVLAALPWSLNETGMGEEIIYKLLVGLVVLLLVWRASRPNWRRSAVLGLGIGVSLLCRSPLFLFPPLLAAYELLRRDPAQSRRARLAGIAALLLCSYILLMPWVLMNLRLHGRLIPLEDGRANSDVATAAMGLGPNLSGNYRWLAGIPEESRVLPWAARHVLRHPAPYLAGCLERLRFALRLQPLLWVTALVGFAFNFRRESFRQVGLFCGYFVTVHCLLAIEKRYLEPVWVLLAVLSAAGACGIGSSAGAGRKDFLTAGAAACLPGAAPPGGKKRIGWLAWPYLAAAGSAGLATLWGIGSYPGRPLPPVEVPVARALRRYPADAWLLHLYSRELLHRGQASAAVASARRALELAPRQYPMLFTYVWALAASGQATQVWMDRLNVGGEPKSEQAPDAGHLLEALWHLQAGRNRQAAAAYARALSSWRAHPPRLRQLEEPRDASSAERMRRIDAQLLRIDTQLEDLTKELLASWPEPARGELARRILDGSSRLRPLLLGGARPQAGPLVGLADDLRSQARQSQERKDYWQALRLLDRLVRSEPSDAKLRNDRGVVYALLGRRREARADFAAALRLEPALASAYLSLGSLVTGRDGPRQAARLYEAALREACPRLEPELCRLLDEPGAQACFTHEPRICGLIMQELDRLQARLPHDRQGTSSGRSVPVR